MKNSKKINRIKTFSLAALGLLSAGIFITGCSKKNEGCTNPLAINYDKTAEEDDGSCLLAGKPGYNTIVAFPNSNGTPVISRHLYRDTAYVKFNSITSPGDNPGGYNLIVAGEPGEDHVHIKGLRPGNYFLFMAGWDAVLGKRVTGGVPVTVTNIATEVDVTVPVTE
jgi:hypothetical protein